VSDERGKDVKKEETAMSLTPKEKKVIELIRETQYGEIKIIIQNYQPVGIEEITKFITL
jgi:hypothetical protein